VAGAGTLSYRVYDPWRHWRDTPGLLGAVAAVVLAASPHNTQPWTFGIRADAVDVYVDAARGTGTVDLFHREQYIGHSSESGWWWYQRARAWCRRRHPDQCR